MAGRWELTEEQWMLVEPVLRPARREDKRGRPWHETRAVLNEVLWVLGTGAQWRELPDKYHPFQTCHRRFQQWVRTGKLEEALLLLARRKRSSMPPSQAPKRGLCGRSNASGQGHQDRRCRRWQQSSSRRLCAKRFACRGQLLEEILAGSFLDEPPTRLIGDKAYDSDKLDQKLRDEYGIEMIAPNRRNRGKPRTGASFAATRSAGRSNASSPGCITSEDSSLDGNTTSKTSSASSNSPASTCSSNVYETASNA